MNKGTAGKNKAWYSGESKSMEMVKHEGAMQGWEEIRANCRFLKKGRLPVSLISF